MTDVAKTILEQIKYGQTSDQKRGSLAMMCWGARKFRAFSLGLAFKVSGHKLKGNVIIELDESKDMYIVKFYNTRMTLKKQFDDVYCDQLTELIDGFVEQ
jgi:hypothetical protein